MDALRRRTGTRGAGYLGEAAERTRVLLVEDAPFIRHAFGRLLRRNGFEVCEANDGREALERVSDFHPQLILTDLMMPVMDGFELTRRLQAHPETSLLPVLAITADSTAQTERRAREAGALDVITKPIDLGDVLDRIRALRDRHGRRIGRDDE